MSESTAMCVQRSDTRHTPAGLGALVEDVDGASVDTRLTVPCSLTPSDILSMQHGCRLATQKETEDDGKLYRYIDMPKAIVIGQGEEARVAPPDLPIGFKVNCATAVAQDPKHFWEDMPEDSQLLEGASTSVILPSSDSEV